MFQLWRLGLRHWDIYCWVYVRTIVELIPPLHFGYGVLYYW